MSIGCYYMPFHWPFLHVVGVGLLFTLGSDIKLTVPVGILCTLLYFFPRSVLSLLGLFVFWMLWPIIGAARKQLAALIQSPYGTGSDEEKAKAKRAEESIADEGRRIFGRLNMDSAHTSEVPTRLSQGLQEIGLKRTHIEAASLLHEYDGNHSGRLTSDEFLQLVAAETAQAGTTHYDVLRTHRGAMPADLKRCYKRMSLLLHPDKNPRASAGQTRRVPAFARGLNSQHAVQHAHGFAGFRVAPCG